MNRLVGWFTTLALVTVVQTFAGVEVVLLDGLHLAGSSVERHGDEFQLETSEGTRVAIPIELVRQIRLTGEPPILCDHGNGAVRDAGASESRSTDRADLDRQERIEGIGQRLDSSGSEARPTSTGPASDAEQRQEEPRRSHDDPQLPDAELSAIRPSSLSPTRSEQLAAFNRDPATFQTGPISPTWRYNDVLGFEKDVTQFSPSRFNRAPIDPGWRYDDVLGYESDVTRFAPWKWRRPPVWYPKDGWRPNEVPSRDD